MRPRLVLVAVTGLCLAACGAFRGPAAGDSNVIPWIDVTTATPTPSPVIPASTPACAVQDLQVAYAGGQGLGGGQLVGSITFVNISGIPCVLQGVPGFILFDAHGSQIPTTRSGYLITDRSDPVLLHDHGRSAQAYVPFAWSAIHQSTGGSECPSPAASAIRLELPQGGGAVVVSAASPTGRPGAIAPCHGLIAVGAFQVVEQPTDPMPPARAFAYRVALPPSVRAGATLSYTVTVTNITAGTVTFPNPCPAYHEDLYPDSRLSGAPLGKHRYLLNCRPAGSVASNASVTFAMLLDVPATAASGSYTLLWAPDWGGVDDIQRVPITIAGGS